MAKSLLLNVLVEVLGNYVEGLTRENLKVGVWSGKLEFQNLNLKDSALDQLNLPIQVKKGSLKSLKVKVPWTNLESKPVEVFIDGLYLLAAPLDLSQSTPEVSRQMNIALRKKKLKQLDEAIMISLRDKKDIQASAKKASYFQQLAAAIVDNLEVQITNVHIRYEDSCSDPDHTFCCGVTFDKILLTTTDESWTAKFVKRDLNNKASAVHKIGTVDNCSIYWNINGRSHIQMTINEWETTMNNLIFRESNTVMDETLSYILSPPNQLVVKLMHREVCTELVPNVDLIIESSVLGIYMDREQFHQMMLLTKSFTVLDRKRLMCLYRPSHRPVSSNKGAAKEWWHYAYRLVTGRDLNTANKVIPVYTSGCSFRHCFLFELSFSLYKI